MDMPVHNFFYRNYTNVNENQEQATKNFFDMLNFLSENFIFSYIGVSFFTFPKHHFEPIYIVASFVAILLGRALNVYPLSAILNIKVLIGVLLSVKVY